MTDLPNVQQALEAIRDPALADQNAVLGTVEDEIASSELSIREIDRMIAEVQGNKRKEQKRLVVLKKRARVFRRAVFELSNISQDHRHD